MKYKLISKILEETICSKVVIDGFDYYVSITPDKNYEGYYVVYDKLFHTSKIMLQSGCKKVIATNNSNIDLPQVIDEVEELAKNYTKDGTKHYMEKTNVEQSFIAGYNKSQETHSFSEDDMIEFGKFRICALDSPYKNLPTEELFKFWKEQKIKTIYYG